MDEVEYLAAMKQIVTALRESGYDPYEQLSGYVESGLSTYITRRNNARAIAERIGVQKIKKYLAERGNELN